MQFPSVVVLISTYFVLDRYYRLQLHSKDSVAFTITTAIRKPGAHAKAKSLISFKLVALLETELNSMLPIPTRLKQDSHGLPHLSRIASHNRMRQTTRESEGMAEKTKQDTVRLRFFQKIKRKIK